MLAGSRTLLWTLLLQFIGGVFSKRCNMECRQQLACAVRGSSVLFFCLFNDTKRHEEKRFIWGHLRFSKVHLILNPSRNVSGRFEYTGDREHNCSMKIHQVEHSDAGKYFFRYNNNKGCPNKCIFLKVTDLNILAETANGEAFKEGDSVNLTCINNCDHINTSSAYSWFKDGESINEEHVLHLTNVSTKHSGNYTCSLKVQNETTSEVFRLDVEYGPKNTSVLIRSSSEADTNGSIILICSSDAQPPVQNYSWFEIVDGQLLNVGHQAEMFPKHSGQYLCSVSHKHGSQNSTVFTLKMKTWTFLRDVLVTITVAIVLVIVGIWSCMWAKRLKPIMTVMTAIIAVCRLTKNKRKTPEAAHQEERQRIDATIQHGGSHCFQSEDLIFEETTTEVIYAAIDFQTNRVPNKEQMDYQRESVIYSTVCRSQLLNHSNRASS